MSARHIPVRPDLGQLENQAKALFRAIQRGDASAIEELKTHHSGPPTRSLYNLPTLSLHWLEATALEAGLGRRQNKLAHALPSA